MRFLKLTFFQCWTILVNNSRAKIVNDFAYEKRTAIKTYLQPDGNTGLWEAGLKNLGLTRLIQISINDKHGSDSVRLRENVFVKVFLS